MNAESTGYEVELATDADRGPILEIMETSFASVQRSSSVLRGPEFWEWKYRSSPFGIASVQQIKLDGKVVAAQSLWPVTFQWQEREFHALQACDTVVHPDFRRQGLFKALLMARKTRAAALNADFIFNFPNANSWPGNLKAGWHFLGRVPWYVRIIKPITLIRDYGKEGRSASLAVPERYRVTETMLDWLEGAVAGDRRGLSLTRPTGYWRWRFLKRPSRQYGLVCMETNCKSFAVFTLSRKASGLIELVVVDLIATRETLSPLLRVVLGCGREVGAAFVAMMNPQAFSAGTFYRHGFVPVREKNLVYLPVNPDLPREIGEIREWDFRAAIHDTI